MKFYLTTLKDGFLILPLFFFLLAGNYRTQAACTMQVSATVSYTCTGNGKDGIVKLNITNGAAPYVVTFNGNTQLNITVNQLTFSSLGQGNYGYTVVDKNSCVVSGSISVARNTLPSAKVASNQTECANAGNTYALGFNPVSGNTYSWTSNPSGFTSTSSNPGVTPTISTTYTLTETNPNGCSKTNSLTITLTPVPSVSISADNNLICIGGNAITLHGRPSGGTYTGDGLTDSIFDPSYAGLGNHKITYTYTDGSGCYSSAYTIIKVVPLATVSISAPYTSMCIDGGQIALTPSPSGGIFAGDGMSDSIFDPVSAGVGGHTITYYYSTGSGCLSSEYIVLTVNPLPTVTLNSVSVCLNNGKFTIQSSPSGTGALYSGDGVSGNMFDPSAAGVGQHTISFVFTDTNGCSSATTATFTVLPLPSVSQSGFSNVCIDNGSITLSGGSPSGGTYSGDGISSGIFNPATAGAGTHTISYTVIGQNGCQNTATASLQVFALPVLSLPSKSVCIDAGSFTINASPSGGTLSGSGVSGTTFDPASAGSGQHTINYSYTDGNGCTATASTTYTVYSLPVVSVTSVNPVCINGGSITLSGSPSGGTFSGNGVSNGIFDPVAAGVGTSSITYSYSDGNGCTSSASTSIVVNDKPSVSINSYSPVCINSGTLTLSGSPSGGSFSGNGVSGSSFDPQSAGAGTHTITYTYTDNNGCSGSASTSITVNALPNVSINSHAAICIDGGSFSLSGSPSGGTFSGAGMSGSTFDPAAAGVGQHSITYSYSDGNGCSNSASTSISVNALPTVTMSALSSTCENCGTVALSGSPSGGSFSGTGVSGSSFDPSVSGTGTFTIYYTYTDGNGCSATASQQITVNAAVHVTIDAHAAVCANAGTFTLSASPSGGTFSGDGVTCSTFSPSAAGAGTHTITYTYATLSASTDITVNPSPFASFTVSDYGHCIDGNSFGFSDSSSITADSITTWSWAFGDNTSSTLQNPSHSYNTSGTFNVSLTVKSSDGCSSEASSGVKVYSMPNANAGSDTVINSGSTINIGANASTGSTYNWSSVPSGFTSSAANPSVSPTDTITYIVTETNSGGCTDIDSISVYVIPVTGPALDVDGHTSFCQGGSVKLEVDETKGKNEENHYSHQKHSKYSKCHKKQTGKPSYQWYNENGAISHATGNSFDATASGSYYVIITTDGNSITSQSVTVTVYDLPIAYTGQDQTICKGSSVTLGGTGVTGSTYLWTLKGGHKNHNSFSETTSDVSVSPSKTTSYTLTETNAHGCINSNDVKVNIEELPNVHLDAFDDKCIDGSAVKLDGGSPKGGVYSGDGVSNGYFNPSSAGTGAHTITYTYTNIGGCSDNATAVIKVISIDHPTITANGSTSFCEGGSVKLSSSSGASYSWSNENGPVLSAGKSSQSINISKSGTYYVTVSSNGCSKTSDGITVTVNPQPEADAGSDITYNYGYDDCPEIDGSANVKGASYTWSTGDTSQNVTVCPSSTTSYWLTVTKNGCTSYKDYVKVYVRDVHCSSKEKDHDKKCVICHYDSKKKKWGHVTVYKTDVEKCKKNGDKFDDCDDFGDIMPELSTDNQINIYPNPFTSVTTIRLTYPKAQMVTLELLSIDGKLITTIFSGNVSDHTPYNFTIDGSGLLPGIYFVRIIGESHVDYRRIELVR